MVSSVEVCISDEKRRDKEIGCAMASDIKAIDGASRRCAGMGLDCIVHLPRRGGNFHQ